ncbi:MAG: tRNA pseudouridine(55) synthase TruB [Chromatiaceae bacterium]|nr:MAG: tRNA pseudouridine(55) synthase TruB [Chromatiaceae bacterium]
MGRRRSRGRAVNGILLLDKPLGLSSNHALQQVKRRFDAAKAGHTGSLDPLATGLLPLCFGHSTKFSAFLLDADKRYLVRVRLGVRTETADAEGEVVATAPTDHVTAAAVREVLVGFVGSIEQLPPMYSAVKHQGQRLYRLARAGQEVVRAPRRIQIYALELLGLDLPDLEIMVHCSKGTYVRTLAEDIGAQLGCGGHVAALRRTAVGPYVEGSSRFIEMATIEAAAEQGSAALDALLLPLDSMLDHCAPLRLSADAAFYLGQGQPVLIPQAPTAGLVRLYDVSGHFLGIGEILDDGRVQPKRLI